MGGIKNFLLLSCILLFSANSFGFVIAQTCNVTLPAFKFKEGPRYRNIGKTTLRETKCNAQYVYFNVGDKELKIERLHPRVSVTENRNTQSSPSWFGGGSNSSELGRGGRSSTSQRQGSYAPRFESSFASCYRNKGRQYVRKNKCTSGDRLRTGCRGTKASNRSTNYCYRYVKLILQDCEAVRGYLPGKYASSGGRHLTNAGFTKLSTLNPSSAPVGSVIVYRNSCDASRPAGHIEIKASENEYISDFSARSPVSNRTDCRTVTGIYFKM